MAFALVCAAAADLFGGQLKSEIIDANSQKDINVPDGVFFKIRTFTQDGGTDRAVVTATIDGRTSKIMTAARIDTTVSATPTPTPTPSPTPTPTPGPFSVLGASALDPINGVIVAGPAMVSITTSDVPAFITYKKEKNSSD